jgi:hypothetical protein
LVNGEGMIEKIEISMINETVHNFRRGEFGVESIEIDEERGLIEIKYAAHEGGEKQVLIPLQNVEKCEYLEKAETPTIEKAENDEDG